jgi:hypothetical protein
MSIFYSIARLFHRNEIKESTRSPAEEAYQRIRAKSVSPKAAQMAVKELPMP